MDTNKTKAMTLPERITRIEEKLDNLTDTVGEIKDAIKHLDDRFASKYIERFVWLLLGTMASGLAIFGADQLAKVIK